MRITFYSPNFSPLIGGLESVVKDLAIELTILGHSVHVITLTPHSHPDNFSFRVYRNPGFKKTLALLKDSDVVVQFNVSLKGILPFIFAQRPFVVSHHTEAFNRRTSLRNRLLSYLKYFIADKFATNLCCSAYVARDFSNATVLYSPYNHSVFHSHYPIASRDIDIVFLGRLVSDKGCDILLKALHLLKDNHNLTPSTTIVGIGPELPYLQQLVVEYKIEKQVSFVGSLTDEPLAMLLNQHRIMVVPSTWNEPFGIVALEGIACGCLVIGTGGGGLPEAIGAHGITFPNGDYNSLATILKNTLDQKLWKTISIEQRDSHLANFTKHHIAQTMIKVLHKL